MNVASVPVNNVAKIVRGLTKNNFSMSKCYIMKLQKCAAKGLKEFLEDMRNHCLTLSMFYWDDTVVSTDNQMHLLPVLWG